MPDDVIAALWYRVWTWNCLFIWGPTQANMARGGALLGRPPCRWAAKTPTPSLPPTGGYYGAEMLRNVQQIQIGDKITMTTPWDTLVYRVCELKIIQPDDINAVLIQPGRDLLTLTTCTPTPKTPSATW